MTQERKPNGAETPPANKPLTAEELLELERRRIRREKEFEAWLKEQGRVK